MLTRHNDSNGFRPRAGIVSVAMLAMGVSVLTGCSVWPGNRAAEFVPVQSPRVATRGFEVATRGFEVATRGFADRVVPTRTFPSVRSSAEAQIQYAFDLAARGAVYSARAEFIQVLKLVAYSLDAEHGTRDHSKSLLAGMNALSEADDFVPDGSLTADNLNIAELTAKHTTPVLKEIDVQRLTPLLALQHYYTFAREQLVRAVGSSPVASEALYGLGRVHSVLASQTSVRNRMSVQKAMVLHQAALSVDPQNYRAANELGVLLARLQQLSEAEAVLTQSVSISAQPETWQNLATVYDGLGESAKAQWARQQFEVARERRKRQGGSGVPGLQGKGVSVRWVDRQTFARNFSPGGIDAPALNPGLLTEPNRSGPLQARKPNGGKRKVESGKRKRSAFGFRLSAFRFMSLSRWFQ